MGNARDEARGDEPLLGKERQRFKNLGETPRSCNDALFALLFAACCVGMVVISSVAFKRGDPSLLLPSDRAQGWLQNAVAQAKDDVDIVVGSVALALVLGVIWLQLMRTFTKIFIYLSLIVGTVAVACLGCYILSIGYKKGDSSARIVGYTLVGLSGLLVLVVFFLRKKIALTCAMFTETCRGINNNIALLPISVGVIVVFLGFAAYWTASFIYLYSIPGESISPNSKEPPKFDVKIRNLMFFMIFGFFWMTAFLSAVFQHVVAGAIACWYFSRDMHTPKSTGIPAVTSLVRAVTTSVGSLALGSLMIAVVEFLNFLLQTTKRSNYKNKLVVFVASCLQCILGYVEAVIRYVNKFAYIYVAMHGHGFCKAARECSDLISRNFFTTVIMDVISGFVLFMGKILFTAVSLILTICIIDGSGRQLSMVTVSLTGVISFVVLHLISHIVGVGINTVFVCYLEDLEHSASPNDLYISPEVHDLLQTKVKEGRTPDSKA